MKFDVLEVMIGMPLHILLLSISKLYSNGTYDDAARYFGQTSKV